MSLREQIEEFLSRDENITPEQSAVVRQDQCSIVRACPGSGKTRTIAIRLAYRIANNCVSKGGIAALSFTNVAVKEIYSKAEELGVRPSFPNFVGTLNSFIDQYIFLPYGHLVMGNSAAKKRPELILDHSAQIFSDRYRLGTNFKNYRVIDFHFDRHGKLQWKKPADSFLREPTDIRQVYYKKQEMARSGFATFSDSMYYSLRVLKQYPVIALAITKRFPEIIIDEFQDTSAVQLAILMELFKTNGVQFMLVGDPNQSIYEFNEAMPKSFSVLAERGCPVLKLTHNFRSAQTICDFALHFSSNSLPDIASGTDRDYSNSVQLIAYPESDIALLPNSFKELLDSRSINLECSAIITSTNATIVKLIGGASTLPFPKAVTRNSRSLIRAAVLRDRGRLSDAVDRIDRFLLHVCYEATSHGHNHDVLHCSFREWKTGCYALLSELPRTELSLRDWLRAAKLVTEAFFERTAWPKTATTFGRLFSTPSDGTASILVTSFIESTPENSCSRISTIHGVKGETHEATMLVIAPPTATRDELSEALNPDFEDDLRIEPVRRTFVAVTRPRKLLVLAIPNGLLQAHSAALQSMGIIPEQ